MAWNPQINVLDFTAFGGNILTYIKANQNDALIWANDGVALPGFVSFFNSPRLVKIYPALTILQTEHQEESGDVIDGHYSIVVEAAIQDGDQDRLTENAQKYDLALRSMLTNMPETTLSASSIIETSARINNLQTRFDILGKQTNKFLQIFQIQAAWTIEASAIE